jgi:hypothetical protein
MGMELTEGMARPRLKKRIWTRCFGRSLVRGSLPPFRHHTPPRGVSQGTTAKRPLSAMDERPLLVRKVAKRRLVHGASRLSCTA